MVRFLKFLHFSAFHFPKEYENAVADTNFQCLKLTYWAWITLIYNGLAHVIHRDSVDKTLVQLKILEKFWNSF